MQRLAVFLLILGVFGFGGVMLTRAHQDPVRGAVAKTEVADPKLVARNRFVKAVKQHIVSNLYDADSAKFRNLYYIEKTENRDGTPGSPLLCGEVNAKNRFGGYAGFAPFWYKPGDDASHPVEGLICQGDLAKSCMVFYEGFCGDFYKKVAIPN